MSGLEKKLIDCNFMLRLRANERKLSGENFSKGDLSVGYGGRS